MIQLFKIGSADRLFLLSGFFILAHLPFLLWNETPLIQEIMRMHLGERLSQGWRLYAQALDDNGPLPALVYAFLAKFGLMHFKVQRLLAAILLWAQAIWFNQMARRYQLVSDRNFLFAFFFLVFAHAGADTVSLSPALFASGFLLFSCGVLFRILKDGAGPDDAMKMGLWLGMAFISYQPSLIFIFPFFLAALLFSGLRLNHYFLSVAAALLPAFAVYAFFNFFGGKSEFNFCFLAPLRMQPLMSLLNLEYLLIPALLMTSISVFGWVYANQNSRVNFHRLGFNVFFFAAVAGLLSIFLSSCRTGEGLVLLVAPSAGLMAQFTLHCRSRWLVEGAGQLLVFLFIGSFYFFTGSFSAAESVRKGLFMEDPPLGFKANFKDRSILLLGNDFRYYRYNPPATRYFRFYLSQLSRRNSGTYEGLILWHQILAEDPPQLIYDPEGLIPDLALHLPEFRRAYRSTYYPDLYEAVPGTTFGSGKKIND
jgi:hypothetical protein